MLDVGINQNVDISSKNDIKFNKNYNVVLLNDDQTPMDFVVETIVKFFAKSLQEAENLMLKANYEGAVICGCYPFEITEMKIFR